MLQQLARARRRLADLERGLLDGRGGLHHRASSLHASTPLPDATSRTSPPWDVRVYGSDISRRCVAAARRGVYAESSFRATPRRRAPALLPASAPTAGT